MNFLYYTTYLSNLTKFSWLWMYKSCYNFFMREVIKMNFFIYYICLLSLWFSLINSKWSLLQQELHKKKKRYFWCIIIIPNNFHVFVMTIYYVLFIILNYIYFFMVFLPCLLLLRCMKYISAFHIQSLKHPHCVFTHLFLINCLCVIFGVHITHFIECIRKFVVKLTFKTVF